MKRTAGLPDDGSGRCGGLVEAGGCVVPLSSSAPAETATPPSPLFDLLPEGFGPGCEPPDVLDCLDMPGLGVAYREVESLIAWLRWVQGVVTDRMVDNALAEQGQEYVELHGPGSSPDVRRDLIGLIGDEVALLTGLSAGEVETRVSFVTAAAQATRALAEGLRAGTCSWEKARYVHARVECLDPVAADHVGRAALALPRRGEVVSWRAFASRVRAGIERAGASEAKRAEVIRGRDAWIQLREHGAGELYVSAEGSRVVAAFERVDGIARRLRKGGEERTLAQLRSDIALDLILAGDMPGFPGAIPAGRVSVSVSLASLVGATDAPGRTAWGDLPATIVRQIAVAEGTTLARIVSDPVDGSLVDASTDAYRPTERMRRFVIARDLACRAPGCAQDAQRCDLDHGTNWPSGPTTQRNLTAKHRRHHEYKTRRWWKALQHADGTLTWRTLCGEYTTYPARYDDDLVADFDRIMASIQADWDAQINVFLRHLDSCDRVNHESCPGHEAWTDPGTPGLEAGRADLPGMVSTDAGHMEKACAEARRRAWFWHLGGCADRCGDCPECYAAQFTPHPVPEEPEQVDDFPMPALARPMDPGPPPI